MQPPNEDPRISLAAIGFQLVLAQLYVAIAEGALQRSRRLHPHEDPPVVRQRRGDGDRGPVHRRRRTARWSPRREPPVCSRTRQARQLWEASELGRHLTPAKRGEVAVTISEAKVVSTKVVNEVTSRIFEQVGARGTAAKYARGPLLAQRPHAHAARSGRLQGTRGRRALPDRRAPARTPGTADAARPRRLGEAHRRRRADPRPPRVPVRTRTGCSAGRSRKSRRPSRTWSPSPPARTSRSSTAWCSRRAPSKATTVRRKPARSSPRPHG